MSQPEPLRVVPPPRDPEKDKIIASGVSANLAYMNQVATPEVWCDSSDEED